MKKLSIVCLAVVMAVAFGYGNAFANPEGIPKGVKMLGHLNIIAANNPKNLNMDGNGGGVIFVNAEGTSKIYLVESGTEGAPGTDSDDFEVLDKNGTDRDGALLAIPDTGMDAYVIGDEDEMKSAYSVYVRSHGKPFGWATITTCAELVNGDGSDLFGMLPPSDQKEIKNRMDAEGIAYCSVEQVGQDITLRDKGKTKFTNVTAALLTIVFQIDLLDIDESGAAVVVATYCIRVPIFNDFLMNEYWEYVQGVDPETGEAQTLKNLEVRFYNVPTNVVNSDEPWVPIIY